MLVACGGLDQPGDDASTDATNHGDSGDGSLSLADTGGGGDVVSVDASPPPNGPCPTSAPSPGGSCSGLGSGLECEYGSSWYLGCDTVYVCTNLGTWTTQTKGYCPPDASTCPAVDASATCISAGQPCDYADRHCACETQCGGPCCGSLMWACYVPANKGCPYPRPDVGTACPSEGQSCSYGDCCSGTHLLCTGGLWRNEVCIPPP